MMDKVEKYVAMYNLPRNLEEAMKLFYTFQYRKKVGADEEVSSTAVHEKEEGGRGRGSMMHVYMSMTQVMKTIPKALKMKVMVRSLALPSLSISLSYRHFPPPPPQVHQYQYVSTDPIFHNCPNQFVSSLLSLLK